MSAKYEPLFSVSFGHEYFGNDGYGSFKIEPTAATQIDALRMGYVFKAYGNGFRVFYDSQFQGNNRSREDALKMPLTLVFNLNNSDANFLTFTGEIAENNEIDFRKTIFCFTNQPLGTNTLRSTLQEKAFVSSTEMYLLSDYPEPFFSKPFGQVRIVLTTNLEKTYKINFSAKYTYWRYILVSDYLKSLVSPAIINKETGELFIGPTPLSISGQGDVLAFHSPSPIKSTAKPNKCFQLVENYEADSGKFRMVYTVLPNPIPGSINCFPGTESDKIKFSEIFL